MDEQLTTITATPTDAPAIIPAEEVVIKVVAGDADHQRRGRGGRRGGNDRRGGHDRERTREEKEFNQITLDLARVTRVTKGGKRMRFRATVIVGDGKGRVGYAVAKGVDVQASVLKASTKAKKRLLQVPIVNGTIPHIVYGKSGAAMVLIKPAPQGSGIIAGGPLRVVLQLAGVPNASGKILGAKNKINNASAAIVALSKLKTTRARN